MLNRLSLPEPSPAKGFVAPNLSYQHLSSTLNAIPDLMFELDADGRHWDCHVLRTELLVVPIEDLLGRTINEVMPEEAAEALMQAIQDTIKNGYSDGTHIHLPTPLGERWFEVSMAPKEKIAGEAPRFIVLSRDITERKLKYLEAERLAFIDPLTELPNRHWLQQQLQQAHERSQSSGQYGAVLFLDLDNFKPLNDTKGHNVGDALLRLMAQRLKSTVRKGDLVARWGGDEFIIIQQLGIERNAARAVTKQVCDLIVERLNTPYELEGEMFTCPASVGVNLFNGHEQDIQQIIKHADLAMYKAKQANPGHYHFHNVAESNISS